MRSIRRRLLFSFLLALASVQVAGLIVYGIFLSRGTQFAIHRDLRRDLQVIVRTLVLNEVGAKEPLSEILPPDIDGFGGEVPTAFYRVTKNKGRETLSQSPTLDRVKIAVGNSFKVKPTPAPHNWSELPAVEPQMLVWAESSKDCAVLTIRLTDPLIRSELSHTKKGVRPGQKPQGKSFQPKSGQRGNGKRCPRLLTGYTVKVVRDTAPYHAIVYRQLALVSALLIGILALVWAVLGRVIDWSFGALNRMNHQLRALPAQTHGARIDLGKTPIELVPIVDAINAHLTKQEIALEQESQFASHASHELRTPLAELQMACDLHKQWPDDPEIAQTFLIDTQAITSHMQAVVANLLALAKNPSSAVVKMRFDWAELIRSTTVDWHKRLPNLIVVLPDAPCWIESDAQKLAIVMRNLLDNAATYATPRDLPITLTLSQEAPDATQWTLTLSNAAHNLTQEDLAHFQDRFWRKESGGVNSGTGHAGLGLAIVSQLCQQLDLTLSYHLDDASHRLSMTLALG